MKPSLIAITILAIGASVLFSTDTAAQEPPVNGEESTAVADGGADPAPDEASELSQPEVQVVKPKAEPASVAVVLADYEGNYKFLEGTRIVGHDQEGVCAFEGKPLDEAQLSELSAKGTTQIEVPALCSSLLLMCMKEVRQETASSDPDHGEIEFEMVIKEYPLALSFDGGRYVSQSLAPVTGEVGLSAPSTTTVGADPGRNMRFILSLGALLTLGAAAIVVGIRIGTRHPRPGA
ncbi:MAG TPA: hypothetical protein VJP07_09700 [Dehalococcoidia bacterium]|nr:hypothetical protein [Dehalococcoidia bacterium]